MSSGITDPYEFYEYVHVSAVGNCSGGGVGGLRANIGIYQDRLLDNQVQGDILQENFINTMPAWVNLLLLSSSGPIKTPVGACATAVESVELGLETILSGKAKVVICGGYDDFTEQSSYEFASMKATSNAAEETGKGREPSEMSRPTTSTRGGFMESQGSGNQILMSADLALTMGVPIYGIVALTNTATDKEGRSVPAPGQGILTTAREQKTDFLPAKLNVSYRRRQVEYHLKQVDSWVEHELEMLQEEARALFASCEYSDFKDDSASFDSFLKERSRSIYEEADRKRKALKYDIFMNFFSGNELISPIRGALAIYGLTVDDIDVASFHGTGTKANDKNESEVVNRQLHHLGRSRGNPVFSIFQKYLTGHPKGAAAAWMLNGVLQCMQHKLVPGNRNADNIDIELKKFTHIFYPSKPIEMKNGIRAGLVKSFGFGQVGGEVLVVNPEYLFASISADQYETYCLKRGQRENDVYKYYHDSLLSVEGKGLVRVKNNAPYTTSQEQAVYLDPNARASFDREANSWNFKKSSPTPLRAINDLSGNSHSNIPELYVERFSSVGSKALNKALIDMSENSENALYSSNGRGIGVDVELVAAINAENEVFIDRNFTGKEIDYCKQAADMPASFCGRWCAKEAVIKAITSCNVDLPRKWEGAGAGLKDIEIVPTAGGAPKVCLHGKAREVANEFNVSESQVKVTISHSGEYATCHGACVHVRRVAALSLSI